MVSLLIIFYGYCNYYPNHKVQATHPSPNTVNTATKLCVTMLQPEWLLYT